MLENKGTNNFHRDAKRANSQERFKQRKQTFEYNPNHQIEYVNNTQENYLQYEQP